MPSLKYCLYVFVYARLAGSKFEIGGIQIYSTLKQRGDLTNSVLPKEEIRVLRNFR